MAPCVPCICIGIFETVGILNNGDGDDDRDDDRDDGCDSRAVRYDACDDDRDGGSDSRAVRYDACDDDRDDGGDSRAVRYDACDDDRDDGLTGSASTLLAAGCCSCSSLTSCSYRASSELNRSSDNADP